MERKNFVCQGLKKTTGALFHGRNKESHSLEM